MIRMDMTQMVRQAVDTAGPDVSVNRDKGDDRSGTDFLRMLRGRQQALERRDCKRDPPAADHQSEPLQHF